MKYSVIFYNTGNVVGYLDKDLMKIFKEQRDMSQFSVVKMTQKEVDRAFEYHDISTYSPMFIDDLLLFPHEELSCMDEIEFKVEMANRDIGQYLTNILDSFKFTKEEERIIKLDFATILYYFAEYEETMNDELLNMRTLFVKTLKYYGLRKDFE